MKDRYPSDAERLKYISNQDHILFGTDYSPEPIESTVDELPGLGLSKAFMQALARGNAERLFPRFKV